MQQVSIMKQYQNIYIADEDLETEIVGQKEDVYMYVLVSLY